MANVILKNVNKIYEGGNQAVFDFNVDIKDGEFIVLVGPSGCGKSTTLRMIAGLEEITSGTAIIDRKDITNLAAKDRDIAMVFQNYALYAHMTIYQNMAFSLTLRKEKAEVIHEKVMAAAKILGLVEQLNKKPGQLSGGQRQRVAVGRAIVRDPKVFLFDEPLSNLDAKLRGSMRRELKLLHNRLNATIIYVTHDQIEALTLADRIVIMNEGYVQQVGTSLEVYKNPANVFVASFMGTPPMNFINGRFDGKKTIKTSGIDIPLDAKNAKTLIAQGYSDKSIIVGIRPEHIKNGDELKFTVDIVEHLGASSLVHGNLGNNSLIVKLPGWVKANTGDELDIALDHDSICFFDAETEVRIKEEE